MSEPSYDIVIGLEVHVQLATRTKMFCRCSTRFGDPPNTNTCPVCTGLPGSLPVMNRQAFQLALRTAVALNCEIPPFTKWDRKQYYYPDLPKGYQISQYDLPMSRDGYLEVSDPQGRFEPRKIGIIRAHLEEDAGKSMHDEAAGKADSRIDLNRTGTPLLEIVSQPDLRSPAEAKAYLTELKLLLNYLGVSDCNMQEGSLRVDANINLHVRSEGETIATPIVEVKNMNSFRAVERAMTYEAERQYGVWRQTGQRKGDVPKQTRGWDDVAQLTRPQRHKEESSDYRYFPDPDLVPVLVTAEEVEAVRASLGELPAGLRQRLAESYGISNYDADVIVNQGREFADYFLATAAGCGDGKLAANWLTQSVLRTLGELEIGIASYAEKVPTGRLVELLQAVRDGQVDTSRGRDVLAKMQQSGRPAAEVMHELGIEQVAESAIVELCRELLNDNPKIVADIKAGTSKAAGALVGMARRRTRTSTPSRCGRSASNWPSRWEPVDSMSVITLTTDFGHDSPYVAALKGVILSINPTATVVDLTHSVPPQDVLAGAVVLADTCGWFPPGTIHLGVVDPGVGTARKIVCLSGGDHLFVGPDNGLLALAAAAGPPTVAHEVTNSRFRLPEISRTFHGRDIMAPAAAYLSLGISPDDLGPQLEQFVRLKLPEPAVFPDRIEGEVLLIDSFGNAITNITGGHLARVFGRDGASPGNWVVAWGPHEIRGSVGTYGDAEPGTPVALIGSAGRLELAVVQGSAAAALAIERGERVAVFRRIAVA